MVNLLFLTHQNRKDAREMADCTEPDPQEFEILSMKP